MLLRSHRQLYLRMSKQYPGFHCQTIGLTVGILSRSHASPPGDAVYKSWPEVAPQNISQGLVLELNTYATNHRLPSSSLLHWIQALYRDTWPQPPPSDAALRKAVSTLKQQRRRLVVSHKSDELSMFSSLPFSLPVSEAETSSKSSEKLISQHTCRGQVEKEDIECVKEVAASLAKELLQSKQALSTAESKSARLEQKLSHFQPRNVHKREKRAHEKIQHMEETVQQLKQDVSELQQKLEKEQKQSSAYKSRWWRMKQKHQQCKLDQEEETNEDKLKILQEKLDELEQMNLELHECMGESKTIQCFRNGRFTDDVRECCMNLLALNVGINNISKVINSVLSLSGHTADRLPSPSTLSNMLLEARSLAHLQIGEEVPKEEYTTLHSDATTKFGDKYGSFQISTEESSYSLCLADMKSGSTLDTKELLQETLCTIEEACKSIRGNTDSHAGLKILSTIKNTMSDRHIVEKKFNCLLEAYRSEVLPTVIENWETLLEEQKAAMSKMNNFSCGLHFLVALADSASEVLKQWEVIHELPISQEPGTVRLIRTACKAVHKHGSEQAGCRVAFASHLRRHGITNVPLAKFKGNRFNVVFHDGAGVYYLHHHLVSFFDRVYGTPNKLLQAVLEDLKNPVLVAGCRAMGIISKSVTGPLWRVMESKLTISQLSRVYQDMDQAFQRWSDDASVLLAREEMVAPEYARSDPIAEELFKECDSDDIVQELLQMLFKAFHLTAARLLGDHLEEGEYAEPSPQTVKETMSVPATNVRSERDFALLDRLMREKPNASTIAIEAMVLYCNNKTAKWLSQKSEEEKTQLFAACIKLGKQQRKIYQQRRDEIRTFRQEQLE